MLCSAFDAPDAPILNEQDFSAIAPEHWPNLRFNAHPSLIHCDYTWNITEMWKTLTADPPREIEAVEGGATHWLIWREYLITRFRSLPTDEHAALHALCGGEDFTAICEVLAEFHGEQDVPLRAAMLLKTWIGQGIVSQVVL
jgi:hypothetical protein